MRLSAKQGSGTAWSTVQTVNLQVHGGDQSPLPPLWNSFVGTGIHNGPVPPALKLERERTKEEKEKEVLHLFRCYTHTQTLSLCIYDYFYIYIYIYIFIYRHKLYVYITKASR